MRFSILIKLLPFYCIYIFYVYVCAETLCESVLLVYLFGDKRKCVLLFVYSSIFGSCHY